MKNLLWVILLILLCPVAQGQESAENKEKIEAKKPVLERSEGTEEPPQIPSERSESGSESKGDLAKKEAEGEKETRSERSESTRETNRQFLRLAEPKAKKAAPPKRSPWGGYWGAIYGEKSLEEEGIGPEKKEESNPPKADIDVPPPPLSEYIAVDFGKLASGSYATEYENKYLKVRCRFLSLAPEGARIEKYPPPGYINFIVGGPGTGMASLTVVAKREKADKVFGLESQKEVVLYGKALRLGLSGLTLMVEEIEKK